MKILKPVLFGIAALGATAPMVVLTSCNQQLTNGLMGITTSIDGTNYLKLNMIFTKNIKEAGEHDIINCNNVISRVELYYSGGGSTGEEREEGIVSVIAIDDTVFTFNWSCIAVHNNSKLTSVRDFKVHDIS